MNNQQLIEALQYYNEQDDGYRGSKDEPTANRWGRRGLGIGAGLGAVAGGVLAHKTGIPFGKALKKVAANSAKGAINWGATAAGAGALKDAIQKKKYKAQ